MMKTLIVGGLVLLAALAIAPVATADPVSCNTDHVADGYVGCSYHVGNEQGCVFVSLNGDRCVP